MTNPELRKMLKGYYVDELANYNSDQMKGLPRPVLQKPAAPDAPRIALLSPKAITVGRQPLYEVIKQRKSRRKYTEEPITLEELSFLLWATQGVVSTNYDQSGAPAITTRTVPSAGARNPFETYLLINRVVGIEPGLYRYLPLDHQIVAEKQGDDLAQGVVDGCHGQRFVGTAAVVFIWTAIPYRTEWRYIHYGLKFVALDAGHVGQNLYLAAEAIGCGTCAIGAYLQQLMDDLLGVDGTDEFTVYLAPVGKIQQRQAMQLDEQLLEAYGGTYRSKIHEERALTIIKRGRSLVLRTKEEAEFTLIANGPESFYLEGIEDISIVFTRIESGSVVGFVLDQLGDKQEFQRAASV